MVSGIRQMDMRDGPQRYTRVFGGGRKPARNSKSGTVPAELVDGPLSCPYLGLLCGSGSAPGPISPRVLSWRWPLGVWPSGKSLNTTALGGQRGPPWQPIGLGPIGSWFSLSAAGGGWR